MDYLVHNGSRNRNNRTIRAMLPKHCGYKQYILGDQRRLVSNRPVQISENQFLEHIEELTRKESEGLLYVTTLDGRVIDLATLSPKQSVLESPKPNPRMDSVAFDKNQGVQVAHHRGEAPPPVEFVMPVAPPPAALDVPVEDLSSKTFSEDGQESQPKKRRFLR